MVRRIGKKNIVLVIIFAIQILMFCCYLYGDMLITTTHGMAFWDSLFSSDGIRQFYQMNIDHPLVAKVYSGNYSAMYDFLIYIIFGIWDFPLWVSQKFFGVQNPLNYLLGNLWAKSIVLFFYVLTLIVIRKILGKIGLCKSKKIIILMSTSIIVSANLIILGQYDIITVFFMILGLYFLLDGKVCFFVMAFSIAIPIKVLALLAFVPMICLVEKRILKLLIYFAASVVPMMLFRIVIPMAQGQSNVTSFFGFLFLDTIPMGSHKISLFLVAYVVLLLFCYLKKPEEDIVQYTKELVYVALCAYAVFYLCTFALPYWVVYLIPFLYLLIVLNEQNYYINILLEIFMSFFIVLGQSIYFYWVYSTTILINGIFGSIVEKSNHMGGSIVDALQNFIGTDNWATVQDYILQVCWSVVFVMLVVFLIINCPWCKRKKWAKEADCKSNRIVIYVVRTIFLAIVYFIPFMGLMA